MYSLIGSAKLNDLDPELYLPQGTHAVADHPVDRITELLPWNPNAVVLQQTGMYRLTLDSYSDRGGCGLGRLR